MGALADRDRRQRGLAECVVSRVGFRRDAGSGPADGERSFDHGVDTDVIRAVHFGRRRETCWSATERPHGIIDRWRGRSYRPSLRDHPRRGKSHYMFKTMNARRGMHYIDYTGQSPVWERFGREWLSRVEVSSTGYRSALPQQIVRSWISPYSVSLRNALAGYI